MGYKMPLQSRESTFDCYRLHLFMRHIPLRTVFFLSFPWFWLTLREWLLEILPLPIHMQYYMNIVFIQRTLLIYFLGVCGWGPGIKTGDLIYVVKKTFWLGTRVTVKLCPDVAKIQSLKTLSHNCFPLQLPLQTHHLINTDWQMDWVLYDLGQKCRYTFI